MSHQQAAGGTRADGGAAGDPLHHFECDVRTALQYLQRVLAVAVSTVFGRGRSVPLPQAPPAEREGPSLLSGAHFAFYILVAAIGSGHSGAATRTLLRETKRGNK